MIVIRVEIWPRGDAARAREVATAVITNDGTGTQERGNYTYEVLHKRTEISGTLEDFPRKSRNVWHLLARVLKAAGYK